MATLAGSVARVADDPIAPCFLERWSPRAFRPEPITEAELLTMSEAAWWAASSPAPSHGVSSTLGGTRRPDREDELAAQLVVHGVDDGQVLVLEADSARCPGARTVRRSWAASSRLDLAAVRVGAEGCDAAGAEGGGRAEGVFPSSGSNRP